MLKGIDREVVDEALAERAAASAAGSAADDGSRRRRVRPDDADEIAARRLLERRAASLRREPDPRKRRQKAYALLARNGFDPGVCARVAAAFVADLEPADAPEDDDIDAV